MSVQIPDGVSLGSALEREAADRAKASEIGQDDFLRMLVAQLENQDPLNPQDGTEFTAQLATFSSLEQQVAIREGIDKLLAAQQTGENPLAEQLRSAGLIGKEVMANGEQVELDADGAATLHFDLQGEASQVQVELVDGRGNSVASQLFDAGDRGLFLRGLNALEWDGRGPGGQALAPGVYGVRLRAIYEDEVVDAKPLVVGRVTAATLGGDSAVLRVGERVVPLADVLEVRELPQGSRVGR